MQKATKMIKWIQANPYLWTKSKENLMTNFSESAEIRLLYEFFFIVQRHISSKFKDLSSSRMLPLFSLLFLTRSFYWAVGQGPYFGCMHMYHPAYLSYKCYWGALAKFSQCLLLWYLVQSFHLPTLNPFLSLCLVQAWRMLANDGPFLITELCWFLGRWPDPCSSPGSSKGIAQCWCFADRSRQRCICTWAGKQAGELTGLL